MGTFIIRPTVLTAGGTPVIDLLGAPPAAYAGWLLDLTDFPGDTFLNASTRQDGLDVPQSSCYNTIGGNSFTQTTHFGCPGNSIPAACLQRFSLGFSRASLR